MMLSDDEQGRGGHKGEHRGRFVKVVKQARCQRKNCGRRDRTERDVAEQRNHDHENDDHDEHTLGGESDPAAQARGDAFAAAKAQPDGKNVANDGREGRQRGEDIWVFSATPRKRQSQQYRYESFEGIENQGEEAELGRLARDVSRADVSAATGPDVFSAKKAHQQIAERDRSGKIAKQRGEKVWAHDFQRCDVMRV